MKPTKKNNSHISYNLTYVIGFFCGAINSKIADGALTTSKLQDNLITTAKIKDPQVTTAKLASNALKKRKKCNKSVDKES